MEELPKQTAWNKHKEKTNAKECSNKSAHVWRAEVGRFWHGSQQSLLPSIHPPVQLPPLEYGVELLNFFSWMEQGKGERMWLSWLDTWVPCLANISRWHCLLSQRLLTLMRQAAMTWNVLEDVHITRSWEASSQQLTRKRGFSPPAQEEMNTEAPCEWTRKWVSPNQVLWWLWPCKTL